MIWEAPACFELEAVLCSYTQDAHASEEKHEKNLILMFLWHGLCFFYALLFTAGAHEHLGNALVRLPHHFSVQQVAQTGPEPVNSKQIRKCYILNYGDIF